MTGPEFYRLRKKRLREMLPTRRKPKSYRKKLKGIQMILKRTSLRPLVQAVERGLQMRFWERPQKGQELVTRIHQERACSQR
jgi:hypothetical protein